MAPLPTRLEPKWHGQLIAHDISAYGGVCRGASQRGKTQREREARPEAPLARPCETGPKPKRPAQRPWPAGQVAADKRQSR